MYTVENSLDDAIKRLRHLLGGAYPELTQDRALNVRIDLSIALGHVERLRRELCRRDLDRRVA